MRGLWAVRGIAALVVVLGAAGLAGQEKPAGAGADKGSAPAAPARPKGNETMPAAASGVDRPTAAPSEGEKKAAPENEKQKRLEADTARLLQLTTELKVEMNKSTKDTMSLVVIRKAEEIEKLAHSLKERMKAQ